MNWVLKKLTESLSDPFRDIPQKPDYHAQILAMPAPERRYAMFFTPRSGSSRLTELADQTKVLGRPGEIFNPALLPKIAGHYGAKNMGDYVDLLSRARNHGGTFGCQITYSQILSRFRTGHRFLVATDPTHVMWLCREDIVAQAVSISRMRQTRLGHATAATAAIEADAEALFVYDPRAIRRIIRFLRWMETRTEALFHRKGLQPLRLSYEQCIAHPPTTVLAAMAGHLGVDLDPDVEIVEKHRKLSGSKGRSFAEQFRAENADFVARVERQRAPMLARLTDLG